MKIKQLVSACALAIASIGMASAANTTVRIISFNDFHGNLQSPGNFSIQPGGSGTALTSKASGGAEYLSGYVKSLKTGYPNNVVVSAGDLTGASPLISGAFHDEGVVEIMNRLGLEFNAVGNHEFDYGKTEILRKQNGGCYPGGVVGVDTCLGNANNLSPNPAVAQVPTPYPFEGAKYKYLSANVLDTASGKTLFPGYAIKTFKSSTGGSIRVGFIGMTLKDTPSIVTPSGVAGLNFNDEVQTVNALIPTLRARGAETIVVLIHQGGFQGSTGPNYINDCSLKSSGSDDPTALQPVRDIVKGLDKAVDLVVSGHTHTGYTCYLPNSVGKNIPVTQAGNYGRVVTNIDLSIDNTTGDVASVLGINNTVIDRTNATITPDATVANIVSAYNTNISPVANQVVATLTAPVTNTENAATGGVSGTTGEKTAGDLIADSMLYATAPAAYGNAQIAFTNSGGVRADYAGSSASFPYTLTYGNAFTVTPFGNNMVTMTITAQQLKDALEMQFVGSCTTPSGANKQVATRVLQPAKGLHVTWSASGAACQKIQEVTLTTYDSSDAIVNIDPIVVSGVVQNPSNTYRVTVNSFLATGGDNFSVFNLGTNRIGGAQDIDTVVAYLAQFKTPNANNSGYSPTASNLHVPRVAKVN